MLKIGGSFELTATDLVGYLNCRHLSELDRAVALISIEPETRKIKVSSLLSGSVYAQLEE
jgi:hypothetical protein